jgi:hypothetical protein
MRLRCGISSRVLSCGCLVGIYETYDESVVAVIDAVGSSCRQHRSGAEIRLDEAGRQSTDAVTAGQAPPGGTGIDRDSGGAEKSP